MNLSTYFKVSSHKFNSAMIALIMLMLYEVFIIWEPGSGQMIRNAPEAWLRTILYYLGISPYYITFALITFSLISIGLFYRPNIGNQPKIFLLMMVEVVFLGAISGFVIQLMMYKLFFSTTSLTGSLIGDMGLAIGAGLFEELLFRVFITSFLIWVLTRLVKIKWLAVVLSIIIASFLFSISHYMGNASDQFEIYSFAFRFFAGVWFTALFSVRGFGIVSLTHAFYDIFVILL